MPIRRSAVPGDGNRGRDALATLGWWLWVGLVELARSLQGACWELAGELGGVRVSHRMSGHLTGHGIMV